MTAAHQLPGDGGREGHKESLRGEGHDTLTLFGCEGGFMGVYACQISQSARFKSVEFILRLLYLNELSVGGGV